MQTRQIDNSVPFQKSYSRVPKKFVTRLHRTMQILFQIAVVCCSKNCTVPRDPCKRKAEPCNFFPIKICLDPCKWVCFFETNTQSGQNCSLFYTVEPPESDHQNEDLVVYKNRSTRGLLGEEVQAHLLYRR